MRHAMVRSCRLLGLKTQPNEKQIESETGLCMFLKIHTRLYFDFDAGEVGSVYYRPNHPMKPHRLCMTHHLVMGYDLHKKMEIYVSQRLKCITHV